MADRLRYVDPDVVGGAGDGSSWVNAYSSSLQCEAAEEADLDAAGDTFTAYCRASSGSADGSLLLVDGWTTSAGNGITWEVGASDRHDGTAGTGYRIVVDGEYSSAIDIREDYVTMIGVAVQNTSAQNVSGIEIKTVGTGVRILHSCLVYGCAGNGIYINDTSATAYVINCIIQSSGQATAGGDGIQTKCTSYIYNCTVGNSTTGATNAGYGIYLNGFSSAYAINCYSGGNGDDDYHQLNGTLNKTTCHAEDATGNVQTAFSTSSGAYFTNVTSGSEDLRITANSDLIDVGTDLHEDVNYPFAVDAWGTARPNGAWDVGAHEYESVAPPVTGQPNKAAFFARCF